MESNKNQISLQEAIDMTTLYRANRPSNFPVCETFDIDVMQNLLDVTGCASVRIYLGMKENENVDLILVAVDEEGIDILPSESIVTTGNNPIIIEDGYRCPPGCPTGSPLYSQ